MNSSLAIDWRPQGNITHIHNNKQKNDKLDNFHSEKNGKQNTHHHHFLHREGKENIAYKDRARSNWLMLLRNPCHFFFVTLFDYLNVFILCWRANKINKNKENCITPPESLSQKIRSV